MGAGSDKEQSLNNTGAARMSPQLPLQPEAVEKTVVALWFLLL